MVTLQYSAVDMRGIPGYNTVGVVFTSRSAFEANIDGIGAASGKAGRSTH
jgi:hypothetical protein